MTKYYPAFLALEGRPCMVVGGGAVAERKVRGLLDCGARVTVVSPEISSRLRGCVEKGEAQHIDREYQRGDCQGMYLLIAATDDYGVNRSVAEEAREAGILVNVVDDPPHCDFVAPSVVRRGDITFAISTSGSSPALAHWLRRRVQATFPPQYSRLPALLSQVRKELRKDGRRVSSNRWQRALDEEFQSLLETRSRKEARRRLISSLTNGCHRPKTGKGRPS